MKSNKIKPKHLAPVKWILKDGSEQSGYYDENYDCFIRNDIYLYRKDAIS